MLSLLSILTQSERTFTLSSQPLLTQRCGLIVPSIFPTPIAGILSPTITSA